MLLLFFDYPSSCYTILNSLIICCLYSGNIYLSFDMSLSYSFVTFSELISCEFLETFCNFTVARRSYRISNFITNQITNYFCFFLNYYFWSSFKCICCRLLSMIKTFLAVLFTQVFIYIFNDIFAHILRKRLKSIAFYKYPISRLRWIAHHFFIFHTLINN